MTIPELRAKQHHLDSEVSECSKALAAYRKGPMGLTPDGVKASPEWKTAKAKYDDAFKRLRAFNAQYAKELH